MGIAKKQALLKLDSNSISLQSRVLLQNMQLRMNITN